ncbi:MAG: universal stress protein [Deferrisomatales bacterium]
MTPTIRRILVPLDLSAASDRVAAYAGELAKGLRASLTTLYVVEEAEALRGLNLPTINYDELLPELERRSRQQLETYARVHLPGAEVAVAHGEPYVRVLELARGLPADLIVMGTHGRRGLDRVLFGSTAERVLRRSPVPVLTVPVLE